MTLLLPLNLLYYSNWLIIDRFVPNFIPHEEASTCGITCSLWFKMAASQADFMQNISLFIWDIHAYTCLWIYYPQLKNNFLWGIMIWAPSVRDLSVRMNISNANEHFFPILSTWIFYNPPINPVQCRQDQIQNGRLIAILFAEIDKIFENVVRPDKYL